MERDERVILEAVGALRVSYGEVFDRPIHGRIALKGDDSQHFFISGERPRKYRNGVGLAIPQRDQIEPLRRAVRYLMAIERIEARRAQLRLNRDQQQQLNERKRTEEAAAASAFRQLYSAVWLPRAENGTIGLELVEAGGRPLQSREIHERVMELLTTTAKKVFSTTTPRKTVELLRIGEAEEGQAPRLGIKTAEVRDAFYSFLGFTRLDTSDALRKAIARGVQEGVFGYTSGTAPALGADGRYQVARDKVVFQRAIPDDEIDLDSGFLIMSSAIPSAQKPVEVDAGRPIREGPDQYGGQPSAPGTGAVLEPTGAPQEASTKEICLRLAGSRDQLYKAWLAIANLADKAGKASLEITATSEVGFDPSWLRNAVYEPLEEADVLEDTQT